MAPTLAVAGDDIVDSVDLLIRHYRQYRFDSIDLSIASTVSMLSYRSVDTIDPLAAIPPPAWHRRWPWLATVLRPAGHGIVAGRGAVAGHGSVRAAFAVSIYRYHR